MEHSTDYVIGFALGAFIGLFLVFIIGRIFKKRRGPCKYDERQTLARGKAYRAAFWTLVVYSFLNGMFYAGTGIMWADMMTESFIGVFLAVMVYAVICILNDAYMPLKEKPGFYFVLFGFVAVVNLVVVIFNRFNGEKFLTDGMLNYHSLNAAIVLVFAAIIVTLAVKTIADKKELDEAEI